MRRRPWRRLRGRRLALRHLMTEPQQVLCEEALEMLQLRLLQCQHSCMFCPQLCFLLELPIFQLCLLGALPSFQLFELGIVMSSLCCAFCTKDFRESEGVLLHLLSSKFEPCGIWMIHRQRSLCVRE